MHVMWNIFRIIYWPYAVRLFIRIHARLDSSTCRNEGWPSADGWLTAFDAVSAAEALFLRLGMNVTCDIRDAGISNVFLADTEHQFIGMFSNSFCANFDLSLDERHLASTSTNDRTNAYLGLSEQNICYFCLHSQRYRRFGNRAGNKYFIFIWAKTNKFASYSGLESDMWESEIVRHIWSSSWSDSFDDEL